MKFTNPLIASALFLASQAAAQCRVFNFHVANSAGPDLNGLVLQNYNGDAVVNAAPAPTVEAFWDDVAPVELMANGIDGDGADNFMLVPYGTNGIEQLVFADFAVAEVGIRLSAIPRLCTDWEYRHASRTGLSQTAS
jgi:hypothetical protein